MADSRPLGAYLSWLMSILCPIDWYYLTCSSIVEIRQQAITRYAWLEFFTIYIKSLFERIVCLELLQGRFPEGGDKIQALATYWHSQLSSSFKPPDRAVFFTIGVWTCRAAHEVARVQINKADPQTQWGPGLGIPPLKGGPEKRAGGELQLG